ncbi:MAG: hypothetical protein D6715_02710 [Calditrichaeota bacterium]|nr:MAG: hypothetical protein D6715_02710 [Calditrichota bacterium]
MEFKPPSSWSGRWGAGLCLLILLAPVGLPAQFFFGLGGRTPMLIEGLYQRFEHSRLHQISLRLERRFPTVRRGEGTLVQISRMRLEGGVRFDGNQSRFVWRFRLAEVRFSQKFIFGQATLLDLNEADRLSEDYRWIHGAVGLQAGTRSQALGFVARGTLQLGVGRWQLGAENYLELGPPVARRLNGIEVGYQLEATLRARRRLAVQALFAQRVLLDQFEPTFRQVELNGSLALGKGRLPRWQVFGGISWEWSTLREASPTLRSRVFRVGIGFLQLPRRRPEIPVY